LAKPNENPGEIGKVVKAVSKGEAGQEEIVGFAQWMTVKISEGGVGVNGTSKRKKDEGNKGEELEGDKGERKATAVANQKLCDELFIPGDEYMARACEGRDYHSKCHSS